MLCDMMHNARKFSDEPGRVSSAGSGQCRCLFRGQARVRGPGITPCIYRSGRRQARDDLWRTRRRVRPRGRCAAPRRHRAGRTRGDAGAGSAGIPADFLGLPEGWGCARTAQHFAGERGVRCDPEGQPRDLLVHLRRALGCRRPCHRRSGSTAPHRRDRQQATGEHAEL